MPKNNPMFQYGARSLNIAYSHIMEFYKNFFGMPHIHSLIRLVEQSNFSLVVSECLQNMDLKVFFLLLLLLIYFSIILDKKCISSIC